MSFLSRGPMVANKVTNFYILVWLILFVVARLAIGPLTGLSGTAAGAVSPLLALAVLFTLRWKFDARIREWLDGGY